MAVQLITSIGNYVGESGDSKPVAPLAGSTFYEVDTEGTYVFANGAWSLVPPVTRIRKLVKTVTFTGAAGLGAIGQVPALTFSGISYVVRLIPVCTVDLVSAGAGTVSLGRSNAVTQFLGVTTATAMDAGQYWLGTTPHTIAVGMPAGLKDFVCGTDITIDVLTGNVTAGAIAFYIEYMPISSGAEVS